MSYQVYRGFRYRLNPVFEDTDSRVARGDYKSRITGYYFKLQSPCGKGFRCIPGESEEYTTQEEASASAENTIDAILDSL